MTVQIGIGLPQLAVRDGDVTPAALLAAFARHAEDLGFGSAWTSDSTIAGPSAHQPILDGLHVLTFVAGITTRMRLGIAVLVLPHRQPELLAKELASIDQLSSGRLTIGLGLGGSDQQRSSRVARLPGRGTDRLEEGIEAMSRLWLGQSASFHGAAISFDDLVVRPRPVQQPRPPIWIAGGSAPALARAFSLGDGWVGSATDTAEGFGDHMRILREQAEVTGGTLRGFTCAKRVYVRVVRNSTARNQFFADIDATYGVTGLGERCGLAGSRQQCIDGLSELAELGATDLILSSLDNDLSQMDILAGVAAALNA